MISKERAYKLAEAYLINRNRNYISIDSSRIRLMENVLINYGKLEGQIRTVFVVAYEEEGYDVPVYFFINIDAESGKVLYTIGSMVYVEDYEEEGFE